MELFTVVFPSPPNRLTGPLEQFVSDRALRRRFGMRIVAAFVAIIFAISLLKVPTTYAQSKKTRRVLILDDLGIVSSPGFAEVDQSVFAGLQKSPYQIEVYYESLEITLFPDEDSQQRLREELIRKYSDRKPDLIVAAGLESLKLVAQSREKFLGNTAIIFCGVLELPDWIRRDPYITGVVGSLHPDRTLDEALQLLPDTKNVVVVGGMGRFDVSFENVARQAFHNYESKLEFTYLTDLSMPALLEKLSHLPSHTIVYHAAMTRDAAGDRFISSTQALPLITTAANAPVFVVDDVDLRGADGGAVGGDLVNWADDGRVAGEMAVRILNGEKPQELSVITSSDAYMFDWRALKRWGIKESALPPGSIVLNRQPSFWELYKQYVLVAIFLLLAQTAAILGLLWQRARRRKSEAELRRSEEKFAKSFRQSPLAITIVRMNDGCYVDVNETFESQTGWTRNEIIGRTPTDIGLWVDEDQRFAFQKQLLAKGNVRDLEVRVRGKDGQVRTALASAEVIEVNGEPCALSVVADISERKEAEEVISSFGRKLIEAQEVERTRIARELHDDINQRLAMVAVNLKTVKQELSHSEVKVSQRIDQVCAYVSGLESDVQALSHRLHSSKLEYLGLEAAASGFCREISVQQNLKIEFHSESVPESLPNDVSLCLFRILQEALHNGIKYSGVREFQVTLKGIWNEVQLIVRDSGIGFDPNNASHFNGLGLISMKERVRLVKGQLSIDSNPQDGTTILARVPLDSRAGSAGAVA